MKKLRKKGGVEKTKAGELVLVNEKGHAFTADETAVAIWNMCDGQATSEDLVKEISEKTNQETTLVRRAVELLVTGFERDGLVEFVEK